MDSLTANNSSDGERRKTRIVILGGGFGGVSTARELERLCRRRPDVEIVLVSRDNFIVLTPLLFEVCSGTLDPRHCSLPIRAYLRTTRFIEAVVHDIDLDGRVVHLSDGDDRSELRYDQLVLAMGARTNRGMIPGSEHAFSFVIIGGGLVGVELFGELTAFADKITPLYQNINRNEVRFILLQGGERLMPEIDPHLADYGTEVLRHRRGVEIRTGTQVRGIESGAVNLPGETIEAQTIVLAAGVATEPVVAALAVPKDRRGRVAVEGTMRCPSRSEVWAIGDCAAIPSPSGELYPTLAQHALREARVLSRNIFDVLDGRSPRPFVYRTLGMMGSLGHNKGFGQLLKVRVRGRLAWFVRRTYYLLQMPGWMRRLRIVIDWTFALLFRPDIVKIGLDSEVAAILREESQTGDQSTAVMPGTNRDKQDERSHHGAA